MYSRPLKTADTLPAVHILRHRQFRVFQYIYPPYHLEGDEMVKFSMVNKQMYSMFENERKKLCDTVKQRAIKLNKMQFELIERLV
jgi:hypothetical protein